MNTALFNHFPTCEVHIKNFFFDRRLHSFEREKKALRKSENRLNKK